MVNIRISRVAVISSRQIDVQFTSSLDPSIGPDNITITGAYSGTTSLTVTSVSVIQNTLTINVRPMVPQIYYKMTLASTTSVQIRGTHGERFLEDGATNIAFFVGADETSELRNNIINDIPPIYDTNAGTLIYDGVTSSATKLQNSLYAIGEVGNANYITIRVDDEEITRGSGPFDRFSQESVYKLIRVGSTQTGSTTEATLSYDEFPASPVSLQQISVLSEIVSNSSNDSNSFNGLLINVANGPVIQVTSLVLTRSGQEYEYDIEQYKYGILNSKYDVSNSYYAANLESNQIQLNNSAIGPTFPFPQGNDTITISYYYKRDGRIIDSDTINITDNVSIIREQVPAVATSFFLDHAPVVDNNGDIPVLSGITWLDPAQNFDSSKKHPAFTSEIQYNTASLPSLPGQYSVEYATGRVFVFGVDGSGTDGTTTVPPVATYKFRQTFQDGLDYIFYSDLNEVASLPNRDLRGNKAIVAFEYEDTFADGTDFSFNSHVEVINERVNNRLIDTIGLRTANPRVNEVFRIYNETTGEIYNATRINNDEVYFTSNQAPRIVEVTREAARFKTVIQSQIVITDRISITGKSFIAFKVELEDTNIGSASENFIGSSFNSSLVLSDTDTFINEYFYDPDDDLGDNLVRLQWVGDYMVDYESGIIYVAVLSGASTDIGDVTYKKAVIKTKHKHIVRTEDIYRSTGATVSASQVYDVGTIEDEVVSIVDLEQAGIRTYTDNYGVEQPLIVDSGAITTNRNIYRISSIFQVTDLQTKSDPIDFSTDATISYPTGSSYATVTLNETGVLIDDSNYNSGILVKISGSREYIDAERISDLHAASLAQLTSVINVVDINSGVDYFAQGSDGYFDAVENKIFLPSSINIEGRFVSTRYGVALRDAAAVLIDYVNGDLFIDYAYVRDEILISYEYGHNVLDWSISDSLSEGQTYYASYYYGALRNSLRDNFGILSGIDEISTIPENLDRETYRNAVAGTLQAFPKGPTIPAIKQLVSTMTQIDPTITESVFLEWILGRDFNHLQPMVLDADSESNLPTYAPGKFGDGLLLNKETQTAILPANSNISINGGTWEAFVVPYWDGINNDAYLSFDPLYNGIRDITKVFIGSNSVNPTEIPFQINREMSYVLGQPNRLHQDIGCFIWYDSGDAKCWRMRVRAPVGAEIKTFTGTITTLGEFYDVGKATTADGYLGYSIQDGYSINEINDSITSSDTKIKYTFIIDSYDAYNTSFDAYDVYSPSIRGGFDGVDFKSDEVRYFFDTGVRENYCRMSLYKDGKGYIHFKIYDGNSLIKEISASVRDWQRTETHHLACSWTLNTVEMHDEMHLFIDGVEQPNTYRYGGYLQYPDGTKFMDDATETLISSVTSPTVGGFDLSSTAGSDTVTSLTADFSIVDINSRFLILDNTTDGDNTQNPPYVYVASILGQNQISLKDGYGNPYYAVSTLDEIKYSINPLHLLTVTDPNIEKVRVYSVDTNGNEIELYSPNTFTPQYEFSVDGYNDYVDIYDGIYDGYSAILRSFGLMRGRYSQYAYVWSDLKTNIINTIMPPPTSIPKVNVTKVIVKRTMIDGALFSLISTAVGGHFVEYFMSSDIEFCQPSNSETGRTLTATVNGNNIDFTDIGINKVTIIGATTDGYNEETLSFIEPSSQTTTRYFTSILYVLASFSAIDVSKPAGVLEVKETYPINWQQQDGYYADVHLSVQKSSGTDGYGFVGQSYLVDNYAIFGAEDIGNIFNISSPLEIAGTYTILDVGLDPSGTVKDSHKVILNTTWLDNYGSINWRMLTTSYGDSGFANGLITLEKSDSYGEPFYLKSCWYEVDFPTYLTVPWPEIPKDLYIGSDMNGQNQANAVIDELRILDEMSLDTDRGELTPSSGRSITTDAQIVNELESTTQTLGLFHFDNSIVNVASFYSSFSPSYKQSENSVNSLFEQSAIFDQNSALQVENKSIFDNNEGTIEFWVSPILDTYNDPTKRYFVDLTPAQTVAVEAVSALIVRLPVRARTVLSVTISGDNTNYFIGGSLSSNGLVATLGQSLPPNVRNVTVTYIPITSQGDRFSIYKTDRGYMSVLVTASGIDYQIRTPVYWKKNTWHRIFVGWDFNNTDNQDRLIMMVDGMETGVVRYGENLDSYNSAIVDGYADVGTTASRNIFANIDFEDVFNTINIGADFTGQFRALSRIDNFRVSSELRTLTYLGGDGPGKNLARDLLYTSNTNTAQPVISDAITRLLLDFNTDSELVEYLSTIRDNATGIFDFDINVIDTFELIDFNLAQQLLTNLIQKIRPAHTRAFVSFTK